MLRILYRLFQVYLFIVRPLTLGVRVMLIRDGKVLLVRQTYMDGWFMPGGRIEKNETTEQAARREAREEVGAELHSLSLLGVYSNFKEWKSDHNVLFLSEDFDLAGGHDRRDRRIAVLSAGCAARRMCGLVTASGSLEFQQLQQRAIRTSALRAIW